MTSTTAFLQSALMASKPIFSRQKISHSPPHPITHLVASNFQVVLVLANKSLQRINQSSGQIETIDFSKVVQGSTGTKVHYVSLDPLGCHLLISLRAGEGDGSQQQTLPELLYLNKKSTKPPKIVAKAKGHVISAVGWNVRNTSETTTGPVLLGTTRGLIFESDLDSGEDKMFSSSVEKSWRQLINLGKQSQNLSTTITGIAYFQVEGTRKFFVFVTTPSRLYQFTGTVHSLDDRPLLTNIIPSDATSPDKFIELPTALKNSALAFSFQPKERGKATARCPLNPVTFGWASESGVYAGKIDQNFSGKSDKETVTVDCELIHYPEPPSNTDKIPLTIAVTEFHVLLVYRSCIKGLCRLNQQVVFNSDFDPAEGGLKGLSRDPVAGSIFIFSDYVVHKFKVDREERNVWRIYLEAGDFDLARQYCLNDEDKLNEVMTRQANALFEEGQYLESAMHFAKTRCSFEEISLKFMQVEDKTALLNFLKKRLELVRSVDVTQMTLIIVWLVENYLSLLKKLEAQSGADSEEVHRVKSEFLQLLQTAKVAACIGQSKNAIYDLLATHGERSTLIEFAHFMRDHERMIKYHLQDSEYEAALKILAQQHRPELYHQYGPQIMQALPDRFVDALISQGKSLGTPNKILPALVVSSRKTQELQSIRFLEHCINNLGSKDPAIHNFLISLYVKHQPHKIEVYLESQGFNAENVPYDIEYTLRLFEEEHEEMRRPMLILYCILGQLDEAVEIGLEIGLEAAERCLTFAQNDDARRRIWLRIARHVVTRKKDISQAMEYIKRSEGLINIEDVLPFFPDFVTIDHFKDAICEALEKYSAHIEDLRKDMEEANRSADEIREDIQKAKDRYIFVRAVDACCVCSSTLMTQSFHVFSCGHKFHTSCLISEVSTYLTSARRKKLDEVCTELKACEQLPGEVASVDSKSAKLSRKEQLRAELDDLVAAECLFCGEIMIKMVDEPLIADCDYEQAFQEWM